VKKQNLFETLLKRIESVPFLSRKVMNFEVVFEKGEKYYIGYCAEIPEANGQGKTPAECEDSLKEAIKLVLAQRRKEVLSSVPF